MRKSAWLLVFLAACTSPRPVTAPGGSAWPTPQANERRAPYESASLPRKLDVAWDIDAGSGMQAGMLLADSFLFVGTTNRQLFAVHTRTGRKYWDQRLEGALDSDLVRNGNQLIFTTTRPRGRLQARRMERGRKAWEHNTGSARFAPTLSGGIVYAVADGGNVFAVRADDGDELWRRRIARPAAMLVEHGDALLLISERDSLYRISKREGRVMAETHLDATIAGLPARTDNTLVMGTHAGSVLGIDAATLEERWRVETGAPVLAAPIVGSDGSVHVLNRNAEIWRITNGRGSRIASLGGAATTAFSLARDGYVVGRIDGSVVTVDLHGNVMAETHFNDTPVGPPAITDEGIYVLLRRGRVAKLH